MIAAKVAVNTCMMCSTMKASVVAVCDKILSSFDVKLYIVILKTWFYIEFCNWLMILKPSMQQLRYTFVLLFKHTGIHIAYMEGKKQH